MKCGYLRQRFCTWLSIPDDGAERARLLAKELQHSALSISHLYIPFIAMLLALVALRWADWTRVLPWFGFVAIYPQLLRLWRQKLIQRLRRMPVPRCTRLLSLIAEVSLNLAWMLYVPLCWQNDNIANHAFLLLYVMGCAVMATWTYGPNLPHLFLALLIYMPFAALYTINSGDVLTDGLLTVLQIFFFVLLVILALHYHRSYRQVTQHIIAVEAQMRALALARDEAEHASKAKSAFLASMSHELRTPLNAIIGFSDMIRQGVLGPATPAKYSEYADDIYTSGQHLLALINDVLDLSKIEAGKRELSDTQIDVAQLLEQVSLLMRPMALNGAVIIHLDVPEGLYLMADERAMRQIFFNLLSNAIKFSPPGGIITAFARRSASGDWDLGVSDQGIGMDANGLRKALEPYGQIDATTSPVAHGTGLGLPIVKALIEAHGALFHIESHSGGGTTVWGTFAKTRTQVVSRQVG